MTRTGGSRTRSIPSMVFLAVVALFLFWPLFFHVSHLVPFHVLAGDPALAGIDTHADRPDWRTYDLSPVTTFYAEKALAARALKRGELPLWNPYNGLGFPLLADGQSQPAAPFFLPFLVWTTPWVYSFLLVLQLLFGGAGMSRLLARLGCGGWAQAVGAAAFAFNPYTFKYLAFSNVWAYVWFPWVFLAAERMASRKSRSGPFALAVALMGMSGHPEVAFMGAATAYAYYVVRSVHLEGWRGPFRRASIAGPVLAFLLSAWWIFPFIGWTLHSWSPRLGGGVPITYAWSAPFLQFSEVLWLPAMLMLALAGIRRRAVALALLPALVWAAILLFPGPSGLQSLFSLGFMSGRYARSLAWFGLTVLTALGLEEWREGRIGYWTRRAGAVLWAAWSAGAVWFLLHPPVPASPSEPIVPLGGPPVGAHVVVWVLALVALGLWLVPGDLLSRNRGLLTACFLACVVGGTLLTPPGKWAAWNASEPTLVPAVGSYRPAGHLREWFPHHGLRESLPPELSAAFGLRDVRYVSPLTPKPMTVIPGLLKRGFMGFVDWNPSLMDFAGVGVKWEPAGSSLKAVPNPDALPRGLWVPGTKVSDGAKAAFDAAVKGTAWRRAVFLEQPPPQSLQGGDENPGSTEAQSVVFLADRCNRVECRVKAPSEGWFLLRDLYWPGWRARVDGRPAPILPADGMFRAVRIPAGDHVVAFVYRPELPVWGLLVSLAGVLLLLWTWLVTRRERTRHAPG